MANLNHLRLIKPTLQTRFRVDFDWWQQNDRNWRVYLRSILCPLHQDTFSDLNVATTIDWVDPDTAEVQQVDGLQHMLITHCATQPGFISQQSTLVDAAFRVFLANGNIPLTAVELGERLGKPANTVLLTLGGRRVYRGIRPCLD